MKSQLAEGIEILAKMPLGVTLQTKTVLSWLVGCHLLIPVQSCCESQIGFLIGPSKQLGRK